MTSAAPEARIQMFMDALIATYEARVAPWHMVQNGALAALGLGTLAILTDTLRPDRFAALAIVAIALPASRAGCWIGGSAPSSATSSGSRSISKP